MLYRLFFVVEQEHCALTICAVTICDWLKANHAEKLNRM